MRFLAFSATTGACLLYYDFDQHGGGTIEDGQTAATRLHSMNSLLLQASGDGDAAAGGGGAGAGEGTAAAPAGGRRPGESGTTILGAGMRRPTSAGRGSRQARPRLALRRWVADAPPAPAVPAAASASTTGGGAPAAASGVQSGSGSAAAAPPGGEMQWVLVEDEETDVVAALAVSGAWQPDAAAFLARGLRDAFVQAHRPQLLTLAAAPAPTTPRRKGSSGGGSGSGGGAPSAPAPSPAALKLAPGGTPGLLTLQGAKAVVRLCTDMMDVMATDGLAPAWLYVVHVESFMGVHLGTGGGGTGGGGGGAGSSAAGSEAGDGGSSGSKDGKAKARKSGLFKGLLSALGGGSKGGAKGKVSVSASGGSASGGGGGGGPLRSSGSVGSAAADGPWQPGPVGQLQHLVLPPEPGATPGSEAAGAGAFEWEAPSVAAAVMQVKPPVDPDAPPARPALGGARSLACPELEDVELELELQAADGSARRFTVVGLRCAHVLAVVAQPAAAATAGGRGGAGGPGSMSRLRQLLGPHLPALSDLFRVLAAHVPQYDIAASGLLLRLLE